MKVNEIITDNFIKGLQEGHIMWDRPNEVIIPKNFSKGNHYTGINHLYLPLQMAMRAKKGEAYKYPLFASMKQINDAGGHVAKGSKAFMCIFFTLFDDKKSKPNTKGELRKIPCLKYYNLFNIEQTDIPVEKYIKLAEVNEVPDIDAVVAKLEAKILHDGAGKNYYSPLMDEVHMTEKGLFKGTEAYYATLLHELTHWTGHSSRLKRIETTDFNSTEYSKEELTAEIGSSFLMHHFGLLNERVRENAQAYINNWITALRNNPNWIVSASAKAEKAYELILGLKAVTAEE